MKTSRRLTLSTLVPIIVMLTPPYSLARAHRAQLSPDLTAAYTYYNSHYFDSRLPRMVPVAWRHHLDEDAVGYVLRLKAPIQVEGHEVRYVIVISSRLKRWPSLARIVLLHEMVHISVSFTEAGCATRDERGEDAEANSHGEKFKVEMRRLSAAGALDSLW